MMTTVTMALGLLAVTGSPTYAQPEDVTAEIESYEPESYEMDSYEADSYDGSCCEDCCGCDSCGHRHGHRWWSHHCLKWRSPCNLSQHLPYYPASHGYYYFRPYNYTMVRQQAETVRRWGGDPRNPYSNKLFGRVYDEVEAVHDDGPFRDDSPEDLIPPPMEDLQLRSTQNKPSLLFPKGTARQTVLRRIKPVRFVK